MEDLKIPLINSILIFPLNAGLTRIDRHRVLQRTDMNWKNEKILFIITDTWLSKTQLALEVSSRTM